MSFPIEWLRNGSIVERETFVETDNSGAIAKARANAPELPLSIPDTNQTAFA